MRCYLVCLVVMATAVSRGSSVFDVNFCNQRMGVIDPDGANEPPPVFFDNFYVFVEQKFIDKKKVVNIEEYYSQAGGKSYVSLATDANPAQVWVDVQYNEVMIVPLNSSNCTDSTFEGSQIYQLLGARTDAHDVTTLSEPAIAFHWGGPERRNISYKGEDVSRGIKTQKWWSCDYQGYLDSTTFTEWQIVDPSQYQLPVVQASMPQPKPILPISATVTGISKVDPGNIINFTYRYDFTHFRRIEPDDHHFRIPPAMMCAKKPNSQKPLPSMPDYFKFRGEMLTILNYGKGSQSAPQILYTIEEYRHALGFYLQDVVSTPSGHSTNDKSYMKLVDDFNTGLSYTLDLESGQCEINPITVSYVDAIQAGFGLVKMRTSDQFFDLDPTAYQYMGLQELRGITCDAWTAYFGSNQTVHQKNTYYTWYFANSDWMKSQGYTTVFVMPVALELRQQNTFIQFNLFEWTTSLGRDYPDLSACFNVTQEMNIEVYFNARFDQYYTPYKAGFKQSFLAGLVRVTGLKSMLRVADLDVQPANDNTILVRFKLLDKPNVKGDVANTFAMAPSQQVYQEIVSAVDANQFYINVGETGNAVIYAKPGSTGLISSKSPFAQDPQSVSSDTVDNMERYPQHRADIYSAKEYSFSTYYYHSEGYSSGAMAGIGIGMLLAGLCLGFIAVFVIKRVRRGRDSSMEALKSEETAETSLS
ncbi:uncharacterized protein LOC131928133 [Physella acuta]|uniref:uncharacterized protein LOC131928133 n=1 Tax=Physella acuta TaxID=109671 RepID=UPI0027DD0C64|nr:uncharacterized protein LOC131928133 [Physella acuta]XP_059140056.1 uncharacterized protein LOC131928133 [Physella acuta]